MNLPFSLAMVALGNQAYRAQTGMPFVCICQHSPDICADQLGVVHASSRKVAEQGVAN